MPMAASGSACCCSWKKAMIWGRFSSGVVVGKRVSARRSSGPVPTAQTIFVPPASMPPYNICSVLPPCAVALFILLFDGAVGCVEGRVPDVENRLGDIGEGQ